jgi:hypothetical protein
MSFTLCTPWSFPRLHGKLLAKVYDKFIDLKSFVLATPGCHMERDGEA